MGTQAQKRIKPVFAILGLVCLILPIPIARLTIHFFTPAEDYLGYGGLGIGLAGMLLTLITGATLSTVSLFRHESPRFIAALCLISHFAIMFWILLNLPGGA